MFLVRLVPLLSALVGFSAGALRYLLLFFCLWWLLHPKCVSGPHLEACSCWNARSLLFWWLQWRDMKGMAEVTLAIAASYMVYYLTQV